MDYLYDLIYTSQWRHMNVMASQITGNSAVCWKSAQANYKEYYQSAALFALLVDSPKKLCEKISMS